MAILREEEKRALIYLNRVEITFQAHVGNIFTTVVKMCNSNTIPIFMLPGPCLFIVMWSSWINERIVNVNVRCGPMNMMQKCLKHSKKERTHAQLIGEILKTHIYRACNCFRLSFTVLEGQGEVKKIIINNESWYWKYLKIVKLLGKHCYVRLRMSAPSSSIKIVWCFCPSIREDIYQPSSPTPFDPLISPTF